MEEKGPNGLSAGKKPGALKIFAGQFKDVMMLILLAATAVSAFMGEIYDAITIIAIVLMDATLGFIQEYRTEKTLEALEKMTAPTAHVIRDGKPSEINAEFLVPGDIFTVSAGDRIPADGKILECSGLFCDEAVLTGESSAVKKAVYSGEDVSVQSMPGVAYAGTACTKGNAVCEVVLTGMDTQMGKVSGMLDNSGEGKTPLQKKLGRLGTVLCIICIVVCFAVALTGILRGEPLFDMLMTGITIAIAAIPEGLPATVTIALALAVRRMLKQNALVHRLHSVETLGCTTVICTDKTGTLTENKMCVTEVYSGGKRMTLTGSGYSAKGKAEIDGEPVKNLPEDFSETLLCGALCNNAELIPAEKSEGRERSARLKFDISGDPTEAALLVAAEKCGLTKNGKTENAVRVSEVPFESETKRMSVTVRLSGRELTYIKGAPDVILKECRFILINGEKRLLGREFRLKIISEYEKMAEEALRVLGMERLDNDGGVFLGLMGMIDAPRDEAIKSVRECKKAGIRVVMITGDHPLTAAAVAKKAGILRPGQSAVSKDELDRLSDEELTREARNIAVYARVTPADKLRIVNALKAGGETVAMTGDGVNDAPAVKAADIGVAMGRTGVDVTKQAADVILLDDDFSTLCLAVRQGRTIFTNIRKLVRYLISCNIGEVAVMFLSILLGMPIVLLPTQILLVNLVTDGLPAVALGLEKSDMDIMKKKPRDFSGSFTDGRLWARIALRGALIGGCTLGSFAYALKLGYTLPAARTAALVTLILSQLIHVFECRSEHGSVFGINPFGNPALIASVAVSLAALAACIWFPPLSAVMETAPMSAEALLPAVIFAAAVPLAAQVGGVIAGRGRDKTG